MGINLAKFRRISTCLPLDCDADYVILKMEIELWILKNG